MKGFKRWLALLLSVVMIFSIMPPGIALAEGVPDPAEGTVTITNHVAGNLKMEIIVHTPIKV